MFPEIIFILASILIEGAFGGIRLTRFTRLSRYTRYTGYSYTTYNYGYTSSYYGPSEWAITGAVIGSVTALVILISIIRVCCCSAARATNTTTPTVSYINTEAPQATVSTYPDTNSNLESSYAPPSYDSAVSAYPPQPMPESTYPPQPIPNSTYLPQPMSNSTYPRQPVYPPTETK